ncbi:hypothetical protein [Alkaliphilus peptidifermentans]|uniref:Uncharacterized protein n=1 Tax=Alkaliphilus peptidifermentans DSM 18978 TaxID=1120976 RepID=A0A1G5EXJ2_9FIRM|nr:hypothetical protein [Alkaliphilus peptidifermentans]SCY31725.1 hypothetical protein SAMN03080606_01260 [Alkaliphilus peptidifermentans DSM 18978]
MSIEKKSKELSRKDFLKGVGASVAGVTLLGGVSGIMTACSTQTTSSAAAVGKPEWPFPYKKLDGNKAADRAYEAYKTKGG